MPPKKPNIAEFWSFFRPWLQIGLILSTAAVSWGMMSTSVASQGDRLAKLEFKYDSMVEKVASIKEDTAVTRQEVKGIKDILKFKQDY